MSERIKVIVQAIRIALSSAAAGVKSTFGFARSHVGARAATLDGGKLGRKLLLAGVVGAAGYGLYTHPPLQNIGHGEIGIRINRLTGGTTELHEGLILAVPGLHDVRRYSLLDQIYRPESSSHADGDAPFQSIEGLSLGVDLTIRYALDPARLKSMSSSLPQDINGQVVDPLVQGVIYKAFTRYTVKEIFSSKRQEIQQQIEAELKPKLAADGILLRSVMMGKVDLPQDYKAGMDKLLAEELETEKMRYTLELKDKQVKQTELEAEADKVRREKSAEAAGNEQIIAAKAQEEAMKHVLPFKQKQIEQRQYEAEAEKVARIKTSEGAAQARVIEAAGEADSRRKLADAEAYRQDLVGKIASAQMERDGALISKHPLLIQKTMADKLSDKISVIIAPPPANGDFIGAALLGGGKAEKTRATAEDQQTAQASAQANAQENQ
ncbi:SPFH domain-containing protein [Undibacterium sp.]|uniref:SPFH domain-containing protein n=1 Tax=Undibacterium sp. TaxID=1914977 RepID=UPI00374D9543